MELSSLAQWGKEEMMMRNLATTKYEISSLRYTVTLKAILTV